MRPRRSTPVVLPRRRSGGTPQRAAPAARARRLLHRRMRFKNSGRFHNLRRFHSGVSLLRRRARSFRHPASAPPTPGERRRSARHRGCGGEDVCPRQGPDRKERPFLQERGYLCAGRDGPDGAPEAAEAAFRKSPIYSPRPNSSKSFLYIAKYSELANSFIFSSGRASRRLSIYFSTVRSSSLRSSRNGRGSRATATQRGESPAAARGRPRLPPPPRRSVPPREEAPLPG